MCFVKYIWIVTIISQEIGRMKIKFCVFVVACFAQLRKLYIFKRYFSRCHAFLTNAIIFLILHKPHIWCISVNQSAINFRTSQLCVSHHATHLLMPATPCAGDLTGRAEGVQDSSVNPQKGSVPSAVAPQELGTGRRWEGGFLRPDYFLLACTHAHTHMYTYTPFV